MTSFLTEFSATVPRTSQWLAQTVAPNHSKVLFMVDDATGLPFAYMGLDFIDWPSSSCEADAIVRGGPAPPGTMTAGLQTLLTWARGSLGIERIRVRVRSDNPAVAFYSRLGFGELRRVPLTLETADGIRRWVETPEATGSGLSVIYMEHQRGQGSQ